MDLGKGSEVFWEDSPSSILRALIRQVLIFFSILSFAGIFSGLLAIRNHLFHIRCNLLSFCRYFSAYQAEKEHLETNLWKGRWPGFRRGWHSEGWERERSRAGKFCGEAWASRCWNSQRLSHRILCYLSKINVNISQSGQKTIKIKKRFEGIYFAYQRKQEWPNCIVRWKSTN